MRLFLKRVVSSMLSISMIIAFLPVNSIITRANEVNTFVSVAEKITFAGGDGTEENPYKVSTPEQLNAVRNDLSAHYIQMNDIDMSDWGDWEPIGSAISIWGGAIGSGNYEAPIINDKYFEGVYNGNDYKIINLTINNNYVSVTKDCLGLFAGLKNATVKNLTLSNILYNINKETTYYSSYWTNQECTFSLSVGSIAGRCDSSTIANCSVEGSIEVMNCSDAYIGGIAGIGNVITNCNSSIEINVNANKDGRYKKDARVYCGGIVGETATVNSKISYCKNSGNIIAEAGAGVFGGGICGNDGVIIYCSNYGNIVGIVTNSLGVAGNDPYRNQRGNSVVGGIVGSTSSNKTAYCINYGNITASSTSVDKISNPFGGNNKSYAGGIVGICGYGNSGSITDSYNYCDSILSIANTSANSNVPSSVFGGRIAGYSREIINCFSLNLTVINGNNPIENIGPDTINGGTLTKDELDSLIEKELRTNIYYGGDRFSFGNSIDGEEGEIVNSLLVLVSSIYDIGDLQIQSTDENIADIKTISIGEGDYITSGNEKIATVYLDFKSAGTTSIEIIAPDGTTVTVPITVTQSSNTFITNFNKDIYVANVLINNREQYSLDYYEKEFTDPSKILVDALKANSEFRHNVVAWEVANAITSVNLDANVDRDINIVSYYEAIIFSLCQNTMESDTFIDTFASSEAVSSIKLTKSIDSFIRSYEKADITYNKTLTKQQKSDLMDDLKKQNKDYLNDYIDAATSIIDYSKDINEFYKTLSKYEAISNTSKELLPILKTIRANSIDAYINAALDRVIRSMESQFGTLLTAIELGTYQIYDWAASEVTDMLVSELITSNPIVKTLKTAAAIGKSISNFAFSTDAIIDQYYAMQCLENFQVDIKNALAIAYKNYASNKTSENAKNYLLSINVLFNSYDLGCEYASSLGKIVYEKAFVGKAFYGRSKTYEDYKKSIQTIQNSLTLQLNSINKYWVFNLLDDCPELFETVAQAIQLYKIDTLDSTMIRLSGLNFDYTGKEIKPKVYICANGEYLKEGEDFTLTYKNNVEQGMASVTVTSTNKYYPGTVTRYFMINDDDFVTEYNIRDNGRSQSSTIFSRTVLSQKSFAKTMDFSISVYDGDNLVAQVVDGVITENELPVIVENGNITILMNDKNYDVRYSSLNGRNIDVNVLAYNSDKEIENTVSYNNLNIAASTECENSIALGTNEINSVMINNGVEVTPSFDSSNIGNLIQYTISATDCVVSKTKAYPGETVWVKAIVPTAETFKGWNTSLSSVSTSDSFSFVMPNSNVSISAEYKCNHDKTTLENVKPATCTEDGYTGDVVCDVCGERIEEGTVNFAYGHNYNRVVTKEPTVNSEGLATFICENCGDSYTEIIPKLEGESNTSEEITTTKSLVAQGETTSKVYSSDKTTTSVAYKQETKANDVKKPKTTKIKKIKKYKKSLKITWEKIKGIKGYQIQYSTSSKFKKAKKITIKKAKITSKTIKKLQAKKKYYVRIRTYIIVNGTKKYSDWSKKKSKKTK